MNRALRSICVLALWLCLAGTAAAYTARSNPHAQPSCASVTRQTCAIANSLGRGINLGNMLEAPREGDWGVRLEPAYIAKVASSFQTVRVPIRWSNHAALTADATLDEAFAKRVDQVVDALLGRGVYVIIDMHHYNQLTGSALHPHEKQVDPAVVETRFLNMWRQIAQRYKGRSSRLIFEPFNEPHDRLNGEAWNRLAARVVSVIRESNPTRVLLIGPGEWNSAYELKNLRLPNDRNLIVAIHNYAPFDFTHQGVDYLAKPMPTGKTCCDAQQRKGIADALETAREWSVQSGYPLHLGEFGSYEKADVNSRAAYTRTVREEAERRGIPWAFWEFASDFGAWSPKTGEWIEPLRRALLD